MTSRDRVVLTLNHQPVDRIARDLRVSSEMKLYHGDEVGEMQFRFASDMIKALLRWPRGERSRGKSREPGDHTDAWGCTWHVPKRGAIGALVDSPLADPAAIAGYRPPLEILERADLSTVNERCAGTSRFALAWSQTKPLERLQALRGPGAALADLGAGDAGARRLLDMLHEFSCREMEMWAQSDVDGVVFSDDWGSPDGLIVSPDVFRDFFKPLYGQYCEILHAHDKYAFFRSDGDITEIFGDLVDLGIDAVAAQWFAMDFEALAREYRGRVTFWGELDRLRLMPLGTPEQVRAAVRRLQRALDFGRGGVIAACEWGAATPFTNVAAMFEQWQQPLPIHA